MVEMRIVFLGTSAAVPTATRGLSSAVIIRGGELLIFDTGEGMQQNFIRSGLGINKKLKIFITHMHADHCLGALGLLQTLSLLGRETPVDIFGPPRFAEFMKTNVNILDRKSTRLNSSHGYISYAVFCLKKKKKLFNPAIARLI